LFVCSVAAFPPTFFIDNACSSARIDVLKKVLNKEKVYLQIS